MNKPYLTKTALSAFCLALSFAGTHTVQADTWTGGIGKFEDPTKWGLATVPASSAQQTFILNTDGDHCLADADTWAYLTTNGLLQSPTTYRGVNRALWGETDGAKTMSFTLDIGDGNMFQMVTNADNWVAQKAGNDVTVNIISGTYQTGKRLRLANTDTSVATVNVSGGRVEVGRDQLIIGTDSATPPEPLFRMTGGGLTVRSGLLLKSGTFEIQGSSITEITLGSNGEGYAEIDGTIKAMVDAGGITPIIATDDGADGIAGAVTFEAGSLLDVSFLGSGTSGTWTILEREGGPITDNGLALAAGVDTSVWSFAIDNTGANGKLTVTANVPLVYWNGDVSDDWDIATTLNWLAPDETTSVVYTEPTEATFDDFLLGTGTVNLTTTFSDVSVAVDTANTYTFSGTGEIAGNASLTKNGAGSLTVSNSGSNNFDGGIIVNGGSVVLGGTNSSSAITLNDTALTINGSTSTSALSGSAASSLEIGTSGNLTVDGSGGFSGILTGDGAITVDDGGNAQFTYNAGTTYTGSILVSDGTLTGVNGGGAGAVGTAAIQLGDASNQDATLYFPTRGSTNAGQVITVVGGGNNLIWGSHNNTGQTAFIRETVLNNADLTIRNTAGAAYRLDTGDANGGLYGTGNVFFEGNANGGNPISIRQPVNNVGTITNQGTGTNVLNFIGSQGGKIGANVTGIIQNSATSAFEINSNSVDFLGTVDVTAGTLRIFDGNGLNANHVVTIDTAGILDVQNNVTVGGLVDGTGGAGTVTNDDSVNNTLNIGGTGTHSFSGVLEDGASNVLSISKGGTGSQTLSGVSTYNGLTTINDGTLVMGNVEAFGVSQSLAQQPIITLLTTTDLDPVVTVLPGTDVAVGDHITGSGIPADTVVTAYDSALGEITLSAAATATATDVAATIAGVNLLATTDTSPVVTVLPGTEIIIGSYITGAGIPANSVVGAYNSSTGEITLSNAATATATDVVATINGIGAALNATNVLTVAPGTPIVVGMYVSGAGIPDNNRVNAYISETGAVTINYAATTTSSEIIAFSGAIQNNGGGTLDLNGLTIADRFSNNDGTFINSSGTPAVITNEMVDLSNPTFDGTGDITVNNIRRTNGVVRRITKDGAGTLTLAGDVSNNRYGLTVNGGEVVLAKTSGEAVNRFELIMNGGTVTLTVANDQITNADDIINQLNAGTLDLNDFDESLSTISGAAGVITNNGVGTSTLTLGHSNGATADGDFDGTITGGLNLVKTGSNTQSLGGSNSYTGTTSVAAGTLELAAGSQASAITVDSGASLGFVIGSSITSSSTVDFVAGSTVSISGTPTLASYTLITASSITGAPTLASPVAGYELNTTGTTVTLDQTVGGDPYDTWATGGELFGDDTNGDGVDNGLAFILGASGPTVDALALLPDSAATGGDLVLTFSIVNPIAPAVLSVEYTNDLTGLWTSVVVPATAGTTTDGLVEFVITGTDPLSVTATIDSSAASAGGELFGRLTATE